MASSQPQDRRDISTAADIKPPRDSESSSDTEPRPGPANHDFSSQPIRPHNRGRSAHSAASRRAYWTSIEPYEGHPDDDEDLDPPELEDSNDLEKAATQRSNAGAMATGRISRIQSITRRANMDAAFTHPLSHVKTAPDALVEFEGADDPYRPMNWPFRKKAITTGLYGLTTMGATLNSSIFSAATDPVAEEYQVSTIVSTLGTSFLLLGFGLGPLLWAPVSELYGRKTGVLLPYFVGAMFTFGAGAGENIQTILICRFFAGVFSSAPVTNTGGVLGDIWHPTQRGNALIAYAFAVVGGPVFGPIIGGAFVVSGVSWRWTQYLVGIYMTVIWFIDELVLDETYSPVLLMHKARRLRISTGNWSLHARHEEWDPSLREMVTKFGVRPFQMLATPICFCVALYASFVYGILYGNLASFPIEFQQERGWNALVGALPFIALLIGILLGSAVNNLNQRFYLAKWKAAGGKAIPEARLPPMMIGAFFFTGGLFIFAWTSDRDIHWIAPNIGAAVLGLGFFTIFQAALNYLIDTFQRYAASAIAANTFLRSIFALSFPIFIGPMFARLGIDWGTSVFAFFSLLLIPIPWIFYFYGPQIRKRGKFSTNMG